MVISEIMKTDVQMVTADTTLNAVREIFSAVPFHHLPVHENNKLIGIISDRDIYRMSSPFMGTGLQIERENELLKTSVAKFMTEEVVTIDEDTLIDSASILLLENKISCLPVVDYQMNVVGIITWKDLLKYYIYVQ